MSERLGYIEKGTDLKSVPSLILGVAMA